MIKRILSIMLVCMGCLTLWAQSTDNRYGGDFNPTNPSDPAVPDKPAVVVTYRLTLQATEGGTVSHNQSGSDFQAGTRIRLTANVNANYKFKHWLQGDEVISTSTSFYYTMPAQAVTLKAVFEFYPGAYGGDLNPSDPSQPGVSVKSYKLTASASPASRGSVSCSSSSVQVGASAYVNATANAGYRFTGWKHGDELVSTEPYYPFVMDNKDAHYTAYFEFEPSSPTDPNASSYTLTYAIGGRTYYSELLTVGTRIKPIATPVRKGHTFNGWSEIPDTMPNRNLTINGSFTANKYSIQFVAENNVIKSDSLTYGSVITYPTVEKLEGRSFKWSEDLAIMPAKDVIISGEYESVKYALVYRVDGSEYKRVEYEEGTTIVPEPNPVKEGHTFMGWSDIPSVMPANYVIVTGSFSVNTYNITYALDGNVLKTDSVKYGTKLVGPEAPIKEGHTFKWVGLPNTMPAKDLTVEGKYTPNKYKITYVVDGKVYYTESVAYGASPTVIDAPAKEGYAFSGWTGLPDTMPAKDIIVTGTFVTNGYTLTYVVDGETYKSIKFVFGANITAEKAPVKEGYTFGGWEGLPATMPANDVTVTATYIANKYKVTYVVDGEVYHTESVTYGATLTAIDNPTKKGYTFCGWSELPETMPAKDIVVTGEFAINAHKITYMVDGEVYHTDSLAYGVAPTVIATPIKEGYTFSGWSEIPETMPAKDVVVTGSFSINTYKITYTLNGEVIYSDSIVYGAVFPVIEIPEKEGHTFSGWGELPQTMPAKDVAVTGTFVVNTYKVTYMVDGEVYKDSLYSYGSDVEPVATPVKEGHTFSGWSEIPATMPAKDVVVTGSFTINTYKLTYTLNGEVIYIDSLVYGTILPVIDVPAREGHTFSGWSESPTTMPGRDLVVTGSFTVNSYTLSYVVDDSVTYKDVVYKYGTVITPEANPVKEGHTFNGWSEIPKTMPADDVVVMGSFTVNTYKVTYMVDGEVYCTDSVQYGIPVTAVGEPVKEGASFGGWIGIPTIMPAKDVVVMGSFAVNSYMLTYMVDEEIYKSVEYRYGETITPETNPTKEGHTFSGWSEIPKTMPAGDVVVRGSFTVNTYSVTYMIDGEVYHTDSVVYSTGTTPLAEPTKEGYTFNGWSEIPDSMPANDVTVVGTFTVNTYRITYTVDGEEYFSNMVVYGSTITPPAYPVKEGYSFSGWGDVPETMPARDVTINGTFTINTYKVIYMVDGEVYYTDPVVYTGVVTPIEEPTKEGYTFSGWSEIPDSMPANDVTVRGSFILNAKQMDKQGLTYELNEAGNAFEISGYTEDLVADVVIPDKIYGLPVSAIQAISLAFAEMKSLVVPASVTTVGRKAFGDCEDLLTIEWNTTISLDAEYFSRASNYGNMLVYVADANTEFSFQGNVIVNGVAEQITLDDELPFRNIRNFTARNITFTKDFDKKTEIGTTGGWEAMILPFDVQNVISSDGKEMKPFSEFDYTMHVPYWLGEMRADGTFAATQSITANKPFIMQLPNSDEYEDVYNVEGEVTFSATNITVYATTDVEEDKGDGYVMLGSYEGTTADNYICALNDEECVVDNKAYMPGCIFVADSRDIRPFEAYVYNAQIGRAPYLRIGGKDGETDIVLSPVNGQQTTGIYDLTGRKVLNTENLKGGVYIVNGRKVVVK